MTAKKPNLVLPKIVQVFQMDFHFEIEVILENFLRRVMLHFRRDEPVFFHILCGSIGF